MQTKREWLAERSLAIAGSRGKFSTKAHEALDKARKEGVKWSDDNAVVTQVSVKTGKTVQVTSEKIVADYTLTFPLDQYRAVQANGTERSMKSGCYNCGVSLVQCSCGEPRIVATNGLGHVRVDIEPIS